MEILNRIDAQTLTEIANKWADGFSPTVGEEELDELLRDSFITGFIAGAIQIRSIVEKVENL